MVTEEQRQAFADFLNNIFNENIKNNEGTYLKTSQWFKNMYYRYKNNTLPEEHKTMLEKRLSRCKITVDEFIETQGKIELLQALSKSKKLDNEAQKQISKANQKSETTKELQKAHILRTLLKKDNVSINEIINVLENHKVSTSNLDVAINELRIEIPGIIKTIDITEQNPIFSISTSAMDRWEALKNNPTCPRISNIFDGTVGFLEHSDIHADLKSTEDDLKRMFEPSFELSSEKGNMPIINLGDLCDTLKEMEHEKWINHDKEIIKLACNFFKNFAKTLATVPNTKYYLLNGNHEKHIYLAGIDILEMMYEYCNNLIPLGAEQGTFMIGNDKIGVFHGIPGLTKFDRHNSTKAVKELSNIEEYIYSLFSHYHVGIHRPLFGYSMVNNGIDNGILFSANVQDGNIQQLYACNFNLKNNKLQCNDSSIELYNSDFQYIKK